MAKRPRFQRHAVLGQNALGVPTTLLTIDGFIGVWAAQASLGV